MKDDIENDEDFIKKFGYVLENRPALFTALIAESGVDGKRKLTILNSAKEQLLLELFSEIGNEKRAFFAQILDDYLKNDFEVSKENIMEKLKSNLDI